MNKDFWMERWAKNETAFHGTEANPFLVKYLSELSLSKGARVFIPLCGKTLDIGWLLSKGYSVAGAELSPKAIDELFQQLGVKPDIVDLGPLKHYRAENLDIFVGDIFDLSRNELGKVDAVYDRAALVALPKEMRYRYTAHLMEISDLAKQLLICYEYDQRLQEGPPFSITAEEVHLHYQDSYEIKLLESFDVPGGLKGKSPAIEKVWLLS